MKKFSLQYIIQAIFTVVSAVLIVSGIIMLFNGIALLAPLPIFNAIVFIALGAILFTTTKLSFLFTLILKHMKATFDGMSDILDIQLEGQKSGHVPNNNVQTIIINEDTTPEDLDELKKKNPVIAKELDELMQSITSPQFFMNKFGHIATPKKEIKDMDTKDLKKELQSCVDNSDFERAALIRDELKGRGNGGNSYTGS